MTKKILHNPIIHYSILAGMVGVLVLCLTASRLPSGFRFFETYAVQIMVAYLFGGIWFLILRQPRLIFVSLGCCAALAMFFKYALNPPSLSPVATPPLLSSVPQTNLKDIQIKVAGLSLSDGEDDPDLTLHKIVQSNADLLALQEVTPVWQYFLEDTLESLYPFHRFVPDAGMLGLAVFSRFPFNFLDTFYFQSIPNLWGSVKLPQGPDSVEFIITHALPAFSAAGFEQLEAHLNVIGSKLKSTTSPNLVIGNFYAVPWASEVLDFRESTRLKDSQQGFMPDYDDGRFSLFYIPYDHIFYSPQFDCLHFKTIGGNAQSHLGVEGIYQLSYVEEKIQ